jgi:hypothetical protein
MRSRTYIIVRVQASTTKTYAARHGSNLPWQASIGMPISANLNRSARSLPAFRMICMKIKKLPDRLISRQISR